MADLTPQPVCFPLDVACPQLSASYTPIQPWGPVYEPEQALARGTMFPPLYKPYHTTPPMKGGRSNG